MVSLTVSKKNVAAMNRTSNAILGTLIDVRGKIEILDSSIKADEKSKSELQVHLAILNKKKEDLLKVINGNEDWVRTHEMEVGPFHKKYDKITADIGVIYKDAKKGHSRGIGLLEKNFGYHPIYKHPKDTFSAIPFQPK